jgi:hypothetical protein
VCQFAASSSEQSPRRDAQTDAAADSADVSAR